MIKVICTGDRYWTPQLNLKHYKRLQIIRDALQSLPVRFSVPEKEIIIIHGAANGADNLCDRIGLSLGYEIRIISPAWEKYGKAAGPIRNRRMLDENPDTVLILAFHDSIESSHGTLDMCRYASSKGYPVEIYHSDGHVYKFTASAK